MVEEQAQTLRSSEYSEEMSRAFVEAVCKWGNYEGVAGKVLRGNPLPKVAEALGIADRYLASDRPVQALEAIMTLFGLGQVSFASKHIRMLAPDKAVVLDSVIRKHLGYANNLAGYGSFLADCTAIRGGLNEKRALNPINLGSPWRLCDVEMAIYSKLRGF